MESKDRILAYNVATEVPVEQLTDVSGGHRGTTHYPSFSASSSNINDSLDTIIDDFA